LFGSHPYFDSGTMLPTMTPMETATATKWIAERAKALGFDLCGVVRAGKFPELARSEDWLAQGFAGEMRYLADPRRGDPGSVMPGIRSVIVCALSYNTDKPYSTQVPFEGDGDEPRGWISRYAWGRDYHEVMLERLEALEAETRAHVPGTWQSRAYVDTGPIQERVLAKYAGLGWVGKNTLLLNQKLGSFFFLGVLLTTLDLEPTLGASEAPPADLCGTCRRCIEECPTQALLEPYVMDARRCIAYLTIELRGSIPDELRAPMGKHVFGCDICQDVCPWNRKAPVTEGADFQPRTFATEGEGLSLGTSEPADEDRGERNALFSPKLEWLASLGEEEFKRLFRGSPIKRAKWRGLVRNACIALGNSTGVSDDAARERIGRLLGKLAACSEPEIAESAQWALSRIKAVGGVHPIEP
jgi:epoxyqueuosine reductase